MSTAPHDDARPSRFDLFALYPAGHERAGEIVTRDRICACGTAFEQQRISEAFAGWAQRNSLFAEQVLADELPGGWTPRWCPRCERDEITRLDSAERREQAKAQRAEADARRAAAHARRAAAERVRQPTPEYGPPRLVRDAD